ncbi:MAG: tRNA-dihydrouridine synthase [Candidatus Freyarchaeota archaeon]
MIRTRTRVFLSAMAGVCDGKFCYEAAKSGAGLVILGGVNLDPETIGAGLKIRARGRSEFHVEPDDVENFLSREVAIARGGGSPVAVNVRVATLEGAIRAGEIVQRCGADAFELNAHCRQPEITRLGGGQALLYDLKRLEEWVRGLRKTLRIPLMVKWRGNVVDDVALAEALESAGVDAFHIDAMKPGCPEADLEIIRRVSKRCETFLIGNNSVTGLDSALKMLRSGAQAVSVARYTRRDPTLVGKLALEVENALQKTL